MKKYLLLIPLFFLIALNAAYADELATLSAVQTVYVPAYSHIYIGNREKPFLLTVTLHVRNVDPKNTITLRYVDYYDSKGNLLKNICPSH